MTIKDSQIWKNYTQTVRRVKRKPSVKTAIAVAEKNLKTNYVPPSKASVALKYGSMTGKKNLTTPSLLERKREKQIKDGKIKLEAKLDLHGLNQIEAHKSLKHFLAENTFTGKRNLLIITGKGKGEGGVLKKSLKQWLQNLPESSSILAVRPAAPQHGGEGAFYILLRKRSS